MRLELYCGPTVIKHYTHRSHEAAERICRMALGRSARVASMFTQAICDILEARLGYVVLNLNYLEGLVGLPVVSRRILQAIRNDRGGWSVLIINYPGRRSNHAVIASGAEYRDNSNDGKWQPITGLRGARLVDMFSMGKREDWEDELAASSNNQ